MKTLYSRPCMLYRHYINLKSQRPDNKLWVTYALTHPTSVHFSQHFGKRFVDWLVVINGPSALLVNSLPPVFLLEDTWKKINRPSEWKLARLESNVPVTIVIRTNNLSIDSRSITVDELLRPIGHWKPLQEHNMSLLEITAIPKYVAVSKLP